MKQPKRPWWKRIIAIGLSLVVLGLIFFTFYTDAPAQSRFQLLIRQIKGTPPSAPPTGQNAGGSGRGPICVLAEGGMDNNPRALLVVMPVTEVGQNDNLTLDSSEAQPRMDDADGQYVGGYTVSAQPTFWFYLPYVAENATTIVSNETITDTDNIRVGKFVLLDEDRNIISSYLMAIQLSVAPRMVVFQLPFSLETDKLYNWHFSIVCEPEKPSRNPVVRGWVQRVELNPELDTALRVAGPFEKYQLYAENEIWFETLSELAVARRQFPSHASLQQDWFDLLNLVSIPNLEMINLSVTEPITIKEWDAD